MPATAGRVRMPANNRVHSSAALQTHGIWQSAIGYDPYAPEKDSKDKSSGGKPEADGRAENAYASFQGLLALARITGSSANDTRGACKKCGRIGHLTYQCRNFLSVKEDKETDEAALQNSTVVFDKIKKASGMKEEKESSEEEEESDSSDSDVDSEIERIIAARSGKNRKKVDKDDGSKEKKRERSKRRSEKRARPGYDDDDDGDEGDDAKRKEKRHRRRYASSDEDSSEERGRKVKQLRKRHPGSDDDGRDEDNRHHHHHRKSRKGRKRRSHQ